MIFDLFDSPELLDIQRLGFYRFLNEGIPQLLAKEFPIKVKNGRYSMELCLTKKDVKLVAPEDSPRDCVLKMKTYNCKLYAQVKIVCKKSSSFTPCYKCKTPLSFLQKLQGSLLQNQKTRAWHQTCTTQSNVSPSLKGLPFYKAPVCTCNAMDGTHGTYSMQESDVLLKEKIVYESLPEWVLLGQVPMMTKRGHFIINGSPRVIVHQVVRSPGIYFQKLIKKDDESKTRYYGDIIPLKGAWVRLQMTKKGRVEAKFKKGKKVEVEFLQKCLQVIENQTFFKSISPSLGAQSFPSRHKSLYTKGVQNETLSAISLIRQRFISGGLVKIRRGQVLRYLRQNRYRYKAPRAQHCKFSIGNQCKADTARVAFGFVGFAKKKTCNTCSYKSFFKENTDSGSLLYEEYSKLLDKKKSRAESKAEHDAFVYTYDKLYRTAQDKELEEWQKKKKNQNFFKGSFFSPSAHSMQNKAYAEGNPSNNKRSFANSSCKTSLLSTNLQQNKRVAGKASPCTPFVMSKETVNSPSSVEGPLEYKSSYKAPLCICNGMQGQKKSNKKKNKTELCTGTKTKKLKKDQNGVASAKRSPLLLLQAKVRKTKPCTSFATPGLVNPCNSSFLENAFKRKKCSENLFATFKLESRYDLGLVGREKINNKFGRSSAFLKKDFKESYKQTENRRFIPWLSHTCRVFKSSICLQSESFAATTPFSQNRTVNSFVQDAYKSSFNKKRRKENLYLASQRPFSFTKKLNQTFTKNNNTQLTSLDLCSATLWLYKLRKGEQNIDDIDHSQNRRVRTSGELLQTQFENGVSRLKNLLSTKFQEWRGDLNSSTFSLQSKVLPSLFKFSCKPRYNCKLYFKGSNKAELSYAARKSLVDAFLKPVLSPPMKATNLTSLKNSFSKSYLFKNSALSLIKPKTLQNNCSAVQKNVITQSQILKGQGFSVANNTWSFKQNKKSKLNLVPHPLTKQEQALQISYKLSVKELFSTKPITGALREFFGSNPLSQYMDQTNPLAEITHKRRISSLGIGGVSRESAGMAIRGIHPTHYGRICPIETPEGKNAGLVNSLAFYTKVDENGFLKTPYYRVFKGQIQSSLGFSFCSAKEELLTGLHIAPNDLQKSSNNILRTRFSFFSKSKIEGCAKQSLAIRFKRFPISSSDKLKQDYKFQCCKAKQTDYFRRYNQNEESVPVRAADNLLDIFKKENSYKVQAIAISPIQMISVATSLIPFLEHNDANRALMGSNMQRQAVPLMIAERAVVGTGLESTVIVESGHITESQISGFVSHIAADKIIVDKLLYRKKEKTFIGRNEKVLSSWKSLNKINRIPRWSLSLGASVERIESYKSTTDYVSSTFTPRTNRRFVKVERRFVRGVKDTQNQPFRAKQIEFQKDSFLSSSVSPLTTFSRSNQNTCITEKPLIHEFDWVQKGDSLSDCSASNNGELAVGKNVLLAYIPWEGYNFEDAIVISERLVKEHVYTSLHIERYVFQAQDLKDGNEWFTKNLPGVNPGSLQHLEESGLPKIGSFLKEGDIIVGKIRYLNKKPSTPYERLLCDILGEKNFAARNKSLYVPKGVSARVIYHKVISLFENDPENKVRPQEAPKTVHLFLGEKRVIQVGDKISGRHGNKGVISTILPRQDMPYLPDGTPIDLILNPLGVPSRMNVGQVLECLLGLAASYLNQHFKIAAFDERYGVEASKSIVFLKLYQARLMSGQNWLFQVSFPGKTRLVDGRSGECFDQWITVGKAYILKLIHMVSEKIHARSTGPYALITQQPLRGRSNKGGQRLGEMEVWALEGFGAAYTLQELLTKKSDDFFGRKQIVDSILPNPTSVVDTLKPSDRIDKNKNVLGHPEIFKVLLCELQALCLDLGVYVVTPESFQRTFLGVVH